MSTTLPIPVFVQKDPDVIVAEMVARYEELTGKTLFPAQVERLIIDVAAYMEHLDIIAINEAAKQNLVDFSTAPVLDYLGRNVGIERLAPARALTKIQLTFTPGHGNLVVPAGLRIRSADGLVVFETVAATNVAPSVDEIVVDAECATEGVVGNGYAPGAINVILDPQPFLTAAANINTTENGSDQETDEQLRQRIFLAFAQSATAGSYSSYRLWARTANPNIVDVYVAGPEAEIENAPPPGHVHVYPLMANGEPTPQQIIDQVFAILDAEDVRPLTDTVTVFAPEALIYTISVELRLLSTANQQLVQQQVETALEDFVGERLTKLGLDITHDTITALCMVDGVYDVNILAPSADLIVEPNQFAKNTSILVTVSDIVNG